MASIAVRRTSAVVGGIVGDAAAQPLHWIYNMDKLKSIIGDAEEVAFWEKSENPFYCLDTGENSCYGDQSITVLKSLVENEGVNVKKLQESFYITFGPDSPYESQRNAIYRDKSEVGSQSLPIKGPWRTGNIKEFLKNYSQGLEKTGSETDEQIDCVPRVVSAAALYAGQPDMLIRVEEVIRLTQNSDTAVAVGLASARLLEQYILRGPCDDAVDKVIVQLRDPHRQNPQDLDTSLAGLLSNVLQKKTTEHALAVKHFGMN
ncbi:hypothetical protein ACJMK2_039889 [Sinanodonta woodiana]|uniref:Crystallin J1A n=1 Tax=Sinanodonta woodiana TaxID=1069815 RepID=A0ABD3WDI0_SINWO